MNDLTKNLHPNPKLFEDDTSLSSTVTNNEALSNSHLNKDLSKINIWDLKRKMSFNPDSKKPTHKVAFSRKKFFFYPLLTFNKLPVKPVKCQTLRINTRFKIKFQ